MPPLHGQPVRVLALDHFFDQDLRELEAHSEVRLRRLPYARLRDPALRIMGPDVAAGLERYVDDDLADAREEFAAWLVSETERLYLEWPFDVIVLPSDLFFYVRALPDAVHRLGIPVVVTQKETTISPHTMIVHSEHVGTYAPTCSDLMTVCSDRQREFWLRAGTDPAKVIVAGQPRFDVYARERELPVRAGEPAHVLFLSYDLDAYIPVELGMPRSGTWVDLRDRTEATLLELASAGAVTVTVKYHPQQKPADRTGPLAEAADQGMTGIEVAAEGTDTRQLIVAADTVVGFQTTTLYEAAAAGRNVVYAAWGQAWEERRHALIPFEDAEGIIWHATDPDSLAAAVLSSRPPADGALKWAEDALGPLDGRSTQRAVDAIRGLVTTWPPEARRIELDDQRDRFRRAEKLRSRLRSSRDASLLLVARAIGRGTGLRAKRATERELRSVLRERADRH